MQVAKYFPHQHTVDIIIILHKNYHNKNIMNIIAMYSCVSVQLWIYLVSCTHYNGGGAWWLFLRLAHKSIHSFFNSSMYSEVINNTSSNMMLLKSCSYIETHLRYQWASLHTYHYYMASYFTHYVVPILVLGNNYFIIL